MCGAGKAGRAQQGPPSGMEASREVVGSDRVRGRLFDPGIRAGEDRGQRPGFWSLADGRAVRSRGALAGAAAWTLRGRSPACWRVWVEVTTGESGTGRVHSQGRVGPHAGRGSEPSTGRDATKQTRGAAWEAGGGAAR